MERKHFLGLMGGTLTWSALGGIDWLKSYLVEEEKELPVLFIGHGSPMNGIENNSFSQKWQNLGKELPTPQAILCISAHWLTKGTFITAMPAPPTIHDFGGFPNELYSINYPAPGDPNLAAFTANHITQTQIHLDQDWGLDHGTWTIVRHMFPNAEIPVLQLSIDYNQPASFHYSLGQELKLLRKKGVLLIGSGNMVHNLGMIDWTRLNENFGYDWNIEINDCFKSKISNQDHKALIDFNHLHPNIQLAIPTPDHYFPLLYILGLTNSADRIEFFNDQPMAGSLTMTSVKFGA